MNLNSTQFFDFLNSLSSDAPNEQENGVVLFEKKGIAVYFLENNIEKTQFFLKSLIHQYQLQNIHLIVVFEFQWLQSQLIIKSRFASFFSKSLSIHGRKTKFTRIDKSVAEPFLNENHLQGYVSSKFKYGLYAGTELVAAATFSAGRKMQKKPEDYRSFELIRFANKAGYRVVGGLTKLLNGFIIQHNASDIMTYVDAVWSNGKVFESVGFEIVGELLPQDINPKNITNIFPIWNAGSLKLILEM